MSPAKKFASLARAFLYPSCASFSTNGKVTAFNASVLDSDKDKTEKVRAQLEHQLEEHANDGWEFDGQYTFSYDIGLTGCFGGKTGKTASEGVVRQLVFRKEM